MAKIQLRCHICGKGKGFRTLEHVDKQGWVIEHQEHTWDIAYCPKCVEKRQVALGKLEK